MNRISSIRVLLFDLLLTAVYLLSGLFTSNADNMQALSRSVLIHAVFLFICIYFAAWILLRSREWARFMQNFTWWKTFFDDSARSSMPDRTKVWLAHFVILTLIWGICLLTYFPGVGMNDGLNVLAGRLSSANQFPIWYCIYVVILGKIGNLLGSLQYAVILYSILQILFTAAISAGTLTFLWMQSCSRVFRFLIMIYYMLQPVLAIYSVSMLKDTVFSSLLVLYGILMYMLLHDNSKSSNTASTVLTQPKIGSRICSELNFSSLQNKHCRLVLAFLIASLILSGLRSNGIYIVAVCLLYLFVASCRSDDIEKSLVRTTIITTAICVLVMNLCGSAIMSHYNVRHNASETLGIPLQQICAVVANDGNVSDEEYDTISHFIQPEMIKELYQPSCADPVKWSNAFDRQYLNAHTGEFLFLWARLLPKNLGIYVKSYLQETYWFWAPNPDGTIQMFDTIEDYLDNDYLSEFLTQNSIHDAPVIQGTLAQFLRNYYQSGSYFPREGICFWILAFSMIIARCRNWRLRQLLPFYFPQLMAWLTIMVSTPINNSFRYVLFYAYAMPLYLFFTMHSQNAS